MNRARGRRAYQFRGATRGAVLRARPGKTRIAIRRGDDVLRWFEAAVHRAGGGSCQMITDAVVREHMERQRQSGKTLATLFWGALRGA